MDYQSEKEVFFHEYCKTCKNREVSNTEEPCDECLSEPTNLNTHRPVKYEKGADKMNERTRTN